MGDIESFLWAMQGISDPRGKGPSVVTLLGLLATCFQTPVAEWSDIFTNGITIME